MFEEDDRVGDDNFGPIDDPNGGGVFSGLQGWPDENCDNIICELNSEAVVSFIEENITLVGVAIFGALTIYSLMYRMGKSREESVEGSHHKKFDGEEDDGLELGAVLRC